MAGQPGQRPKSPSDGWADIDWLIPQLAANLALVRPVSMTDDAAADWLAVAASELDGFSCSDVSDALSQARRICTHHGQIVPQVIKSMEEGAPWRLGKPLPRRPAIIERPRDPRIAALVDKAAAKLHLIEE